MLKPNSELFKSRVFNSVESAREFTSKLSDLVEEAGFHETKSSFGSVLGAIVQDCGEESLQSLYELYEDTSAIPTEVLEELVASYPELSTPVYDGVLPTAKQLLEQSVDLAKYAHTGCAESNPLKFDLDCIKEQAVSILDIEPNNVVMTLNYDRPLLLYTPNSGADSGTQTLLAGAIIRLENISEIETGVFEITFDVLEGYQNLINEEGSTIYKQVIGRYRIIEFKEQLLSVAALDAIISDQLDYLTFCVGNVPEFKTELPVEQSNYPLGIYYSVEIDFHVTGNNSPDFVAKLRRNKNGSYTMKTQTVHSRGGSKLIQYSKQLSPHLKLKDLESVILYSLEMLEGEQFSENSNVQNYYSLSLSESPTLQSLVLASTSMDFQRVRPHLPKHALEFFLSKISESEYSDLLQVLHSDIDATARVNRLTAKVGKEEKVARGLDRAKHKIAKGDLASVALNNLFSGVKVQTNTRVR